MDKEELRIIIIDDNLAIHQDFIKVLTPTQHSESLDELDKALFGESTIKKNDLVLPKFQFDTAVQGREGFEKIKKAYEEGYPYALAFVDVRMPPGWDGIETIKQIWSIDSDIQVVICTAYSDYTWEETVDKLGMSDNFLILKKPFDNVAVRQLGSALTRKWLLARDSKNHTQSLQNMVNERTNSLNQSLSLLRATLEASNDGILVVNNASEVVDYNNVFTKLWDIPQTILETKDEKILLEYMQNKVRNPQEFTSLVQTLHENIKESGTHILELKDDKILQCCTQPHRVNDEIVGQVWSYRDITERTYFEQKLQHQATHDTLTNLPNRILLTDRIKQALLHAERHKDNFAVLFLDLDRFKLVNDSLSHEVGDGLLLAVTSRLSALIRKSDTLARIGGDEFVMVLEGPLSESDILNLTHKILMSFKKPFKVGKHEILTSTSIGISLFPGDGDDIDKLLQGADLAMYQAKEQGGNQIKFYTPALNEKTMNRLEQERDLRLAIANKEFFLVYQPQLDLESDELISVEALIRWQHPEQGVILPLDFIPIAESSGLIIPIGEWVIEEACKQLQHWNTRGFDKKIRVAVNVATRQLLQYGFDEYILSVLQKYGIDPNYFELEITENVIITHAEVMEMIRKLKAVGVRIVLDDFGTGNTCLNFLRHVHFDRLKIDRSFVNNILNSRSDEVLVEAIISIAKSLDFKVIAEGVENQKQLELLKNKQCNEIQGFIYSYPLNPEQIEDFILKGQKKD